MTVLEVALGLGWTITALYWGLDHLLAKCRKEEYIKEITDLKARRTWLSKVKGVEKIGKCENY